MAGISTTTNASSATFGEKGGFVWIRDFDKGMFDTIGATYSTDTWYVNDGSRNIPVLFANPDMALEDFIIPSIVIRRDDITPMMARSHRGPKGTQDVFRGHSTPTLGSDTCSNGGFTDSTDWVITDGWIISDGNISSDGGMYSNSDGTQANFYQAGRVANDKRYRVSFDISGYSEGNVWIKTSKVVQRDYFVSGNGSHTIDIKSDSAESNDYLYFIRSNDFIGSIDNIQIQEITGGARTVVHKFNNAGVVSYALGYDNYEIQEGPAPFDISYTVSIYDRYRNTTNASIRYLMNIFKPFHNISVTDSLSEVRSYNGILESTSILDEIASSSERTMGMALTIRVIAELDFDETYGVEAGIVTADPSIGNIYNMNQ